MSEVWSSEPRQAEGREVISASCCSSSPALPGFGTSDKSFGTFDIEANIDALSTTEGSPDLASICMPLIGAI
ncbi:hypothetical protein ACFX13_006005 [Malus domestica]